MNVKKIFITLITVVACVMIGAFTLNTLMPNVTKTLVNAVEDQLFRSSGMSFDFNGDGVTGSNNDEYSGDEQQDGTSGGANNAVEGFQ